MDSCDETTLTNLSIKAKSKKESNYFWFIKTKNGIEYSVLETTITNPCKGQLISKQN